MIPTAGETSFNAALSEVGLTPGSLMDLETLIGGFNQYSTGATHSSDSFDNMRGFTGGTVWHYLSVTGVTFYPGTEEMWIYITNNATIDTLSGYIDLVFESDLPDENGNPPIYSFIYRDIDNYYVEPLLPGATRLIIFGCTGDTFGPNYVWWKWRSWPFSSWNIENC